MKTFCTIIILSANIFICYAQQGTTFKLEQLDPPKKLLSVSEYQSILENLILIDNNGSSKLLSSLKKGNTTPSFNIVAKSEVYEGLVAFDYHPFFDGMYAAYADHRPFTLSPDMIWLLICQGFANHVNSNSEELRSFFVDFDGKTSLVVRNDKIKLDDPNSPWMEVFPDLSKQIASHTGKQLTDAFTADFSTTTPAARIASQITLMNTLKSYFELMILSTSCGIPEITLEGTPQDWKRVLTKTEALRKYKLDWWIDEITPLLKKFIQASQGTVDQDFWKEMFKYHVKGLCKPNIIDGWVVKFFPYDKQGKRMGLKEISQTDSLPNEILKVDLDYQFGDGKGNFVGTPLELWAGFFGLKQNNKTFGLRPEIGWMIRKKDTTINWNLTEKMKFLDSVSSRGIVLRVKTIPPEVFHLGPIKTLEIYFINKVSIPDEIANIKIEQFKIHGDITTLDTSRIRKLLPHTKLIVNNKEII